MSTELQNAFLALLRLGAGLAAYGGECKGLSPEAWASLYDTSGQQGVRAIVYDGVMALPDSERPPQELLQKWARKARKAEKQAAIQLKLGSELSLLYKNNGIRTYLLKGAVIAECYPVPLHRRSNDMDIFLLPESAEGDAWEQGNRLAEEAGFEVDRGFYKHSLIVLPELDLENHRFLVPIRESRQLKEMEKLLQKLLREDRGEDIINGTDLCRPPVMVSALFLIEHSYSHFLHEGLTWRYVLDWQMFSRKYKAEIDWPALERYIDEFGLRLFYNSYMRLGRLLAGELKEAGLAAADKHMLADTWASLDAPGTSHGIKGKLALAAISWRARWKYKYYTETTWTKAFWTRLTGFLFVRNPQLT